MQSFALALHNELEDSGVTITSLMPGPTETEFFERADMLVTKVAANDKDDPADVARDGFEALMAGRERVVSHSLKTKLQGRTSRLLPDSVDTVPDPEIEQPTDAIIKVTSSGICGSDLHLYEVLAPFIDAGDILGHEPMGIVEEVGSEVTKIKPGDRVVVPFNISCGHCYTCEKGLQSQCETTQVREQETGAALFGYTKLYGQVPGGQAEYLRVPQA